MSTVQSALRHIDEDSGSAWQHVHSNGMHGNVPEPEILLGPPRRKQKPQSHRRSRRGLGEGVESVHVQHELSMDSSIDMTDSSNTSSVCSVEDAHTMHEPHALCNAADSTLKPTRWSANKADAVGEGREDYPPYTPTTKGLPFEYTPGRPLEPLHEEGSVGPSIMTTLTSIDVPRAMLSSLGTAGHRAATSEALPSDRLPGVPTASSMLDPGQRHGAYHDANEMLRKQFPHYKVRSPVYSPPPRCAYSPRKLDVTVAPEPVATECRAVGCIVNVVRLFARLLRPSAWATPAGERALPSLPLRPAVFKHPDI